MDALLDTAMEMIFLINVILIIFLINMIENFFLANPQTKFVHLGCAKDKYDIAMRAYCRIEKETIRCYEDFCNDPKKGRFG